MQGDSVLPMGRAVPPLLSLKGLCTEEQEL